jgi:hypothetical protein
VTDQRPRIHILGSGPAAERWAVVFGQRAVVSLAPEETSEAEALVVAPGAPDAFGAAKRALSAAWPVLFVPAWTFSPWQAALLDALSRRTGAPLRVAEPFRHQGAFGFLQRLSRGNEPIWPLRYVRTMSIAPSAPRIDELAIDDLAMCQALIDLPPHTVAATAAQRGDGGAVSAAFLTVSYPRDIVAQCSISLVEPEATRQLVAVTSTRSVSIDRFDWAAPLQVAAVRPVGSTPQRRTIKIGSGDPVAEEALRFVQAIESRAGGNSKRWMWVSALWWAARQSMSFGETIEVPEPKVLLAPGTALPIPGGPPLRVIEGGGRGTRTQARPRLTLIAS